MGTGTQHKSKRKHAAKRDFKRRVMDLKNRSRDIDRIQDDMEAAASGKDLGVASEDAPGGGLFYCIPCARHFISARVLAAHMTTKPHKRRLKVVAEPKYTHREAEAGAGMSAPDTARPAAGGAGVPLL